MLGDHCGDRIDVANISFTTAQSHHVASGCRGHLDQVTPDLAAGTEDHDPGPQRLGLSLRGCRLHKRKLGVGWRDSLVEGFAGKQPDPQLPQYERHDRQDRNNRENFTVMQRHDPSFCLAPNLRRELDQHCLQLQEGQSGHGADLSVCPLMTQSGHRRGKRLAC
jgi:hypothetical protein